MYVCCNVCNTLFPSFWLSVCINYGNVLLTYILTYLQVGLHQYKLRLILRYIHTYTHTCLQVGLHQYKLRLIFEIVDLPLSWPADVNAHEAIAYCNWRTRIEKVAIYMYVYIFTYMCV